MDETERKKMHIASRQLDSAIGFLFAGGDIIGVHTLAAAAAKIFSEVEPQASDAQTQADHPGAATYREVANAVRNLPSTTNPDPDLTRAFTTADTAALLAGTILTFDERGGPITIAQSLFHMWYLACHFDALDQSFRQREMIRAEFGNLGRRTWPYQIAAGRVALEKAYAAGAARAG